eukprot:TRINITY_DN6434_c0_g1_i1.p1 TRINITY_DN6434_c0_g1~~TRINITY_DN6434_c0_g1_i1.p1  ORF type:complete len:106 (-),score=3.41 TRINITY_DN6434_c0_g1_i1:936-1253(-)
MHSDDRIDRQLVWIVAQKTAWAHTSRQIERRVGKHQNMNVLLQRSQRSPSLCNRVMCMDKGWPEHWSNKYHTMNLIFKAQKSNDVKIRCENSTARITPIGVEVGS